MTIYFACVMFVFGICFGSFYNVVGYRLPRDMSILKPGSHCTTCNHSLNIKDLFPIISYIILKGKCRYCGSKVGLFYPIFEFLTGILFSICYLKYGFSLDLIIALIFVSMCLIIVLSDYTTMIIPDEVLLFPLITITITNIFKIGFTNTILTLINGLVAFLFMYLLKLLGDFLFKKESMGGGDIKLMFILGLVLGWPTAILSIFFASFLGLPTSMIFMMKNDSHEIPFGPFLTIAALILFLTGIDMNTILNILTK